jgi:DNA-binding CsgD family transcriptional regulator
MARITIEAEARQHLEAASASLVLGPATPEGTAAYWRTLAETSRPPAHLGVVAVTYPRSGHEWLGDWRAEFGDFPASGAVLDAGGLLRSASSPRPNGGEIRVGRLSIGTVEPTDVEALVEAVGDHLDRLAAGDGPGVVSLESLTALLEHVGEDTAFRHLHRLTHRLRTTSAVGYAHADPAVHDERTIRTFSRLFDAVVEYVPDGDGWTVSLREAEPVSPTPRGGRSPSVSEPDGDDRRGFGEWLSSLFDRIRPSRAATRAERPRSPSEAASDPSAPVDRERSSDAGTVLTPKEEQIFRLLYRHDGRLDQRDIADRMSWSASTTSRVLSRMEAAGLIRRVRIGRGKTVFLPGHEPDGAGIDPPAGGAGGRTRTR